MTSLQAKAVQIGVVLLIIASIWTSGYIRGHTNGVKSAQAGISTLANQLASSRQQVQADAAAMASVNHELDAAKQRAQNEKDYADAAMDGLQKAQHQQEQQAASWEAKLDAAKQSKGCQSQLEATLCPAVSSY